MAEVKAHWTEKAEYVSFGDARILGEDERGDWFVPSRNVSFDPMWDRAFRWWAPTHWRFWLRSRITGRVAFLQSP